MEVSSDDEGGFSPAPVLEKEKAKRTKRINFKDFTFGRTKSSPQSPPIHSPSASAASSPQPKSCLHPAYQQDADNYHHVDRRTVRINSDGVGTRNRDEWAAGILAQPHLQESVVALKASVAEYEKEATSQQWKDLLEIQADIRELGVLAESSKPKSHNAADSMDESDDGLSKFAAVAFEYSKLLDVVMNQAPEYAALAWGVRLNLNQCCHVGG